MLALALASCASPGAGGPSAQDSLKAQDSLRAASAQPAASPRQPAPAGVRTWDAQELQAVQFFGVEPNWTLAFTEDFAEYTPLGESTRKLNYRAGQQDASKPKLSQVLAAQTGQTLELMAEMDGWGLLLLVREESCSDGMSDTGHPYSISLVFEEDESLEGCGRVR